MPESKELFRAAERLHAHLSRSHYSSGVLHGPDPGVRFNLRAWRFAKSAFDFLPWRDDYAFLQSQGYWVLANWMLHQLTGDRRYRESALETTGAILKLHRPEGFWTYPLPERRHLIATVEGDWGAIGLLASYAREPRDAWLAGAIRWYDFLVRRIGFQDHSQGRAVNYFDQPRGKVPNNSVEAAWLFLRLWKATGEKRFLEHVEPLLEFVAAVQLPSGEIPYIVASAHESERVHYLCFQYNAFQFLKLAWSEALAPGGRARLVLAALAPFLEAGITPEGDCAADCSSARPKMNYHTAVAGAALHEAARMGLGRSRELSERAYARLLARQRSDGSFAFSMGDYGFLSDARSYPRQQVMTLFHLLYGCCAGNGFEPEK